MEGQAMTARNTETLLALSIKQPWASLVVLGLKTIEIRGWTTPIRGRIAIHTGKIPDDRPEGWARLGKEHAKLAALRGGVIGVANLVDIITYRSSRHFAADRQLHCNESSWFAPPVLYGLRFEKPKIVPFSECSGQVKFFSVEIELEPRPQKKRSPKRIVSFEL